MRKRMLRVLLGVLILVFGAFSTAAVAAQDCDDNAVIRCGVTSNADLIAKYRANQDGNVDDIYYQLGIWNEQALQGMVDGRVTNTNEVWVSNQRVATNAITAGRKYMPGSTAILGGAAYKRPPSVSFRSASLDAFVKIENGQFRYAVIKSCGNPVMATPVPKPTPQPQPQPVPQPTPQPTPPQPQPAPPAQPATVTVVREVVHELPNTGPEGAAMVFTGSTILGSAWYALKEFFIRKLK